MHTQAFGIPPALVAHLRQTLTTCGPFDVPSALQALFVDARIHPWADAVPAANNRAARINALIDCLQDQFNERGENALVLFVQVLRDHAHSGTACRQTLANLAAALASALKAPIVPHPAPPGDGHPGPSAAGGSIAAGRDVYHAARDVIVQRGNGMVHTGGSPTGGIRAHTIEAENVVDGVQMLGGPPEGAAGLVELAQSIQRGGITADQIKAGNVVSGLQFIGGKAPATSQELQTELAALREKVDHAIHTGEIADEGDAEDVQDALKKADAELEKPEPRGARVTRNLESAANILTGVAGAMEATGKVGMQILKLAPIAAALWKLAEVIF